MAGGNSKRSWRVAAGFHQVGEVAVIVTAPNWQGGLRKAALAIKALPQLKGRRISVGSFTIQEVENVPVVADPTQMQLTAVNADPMDNLPVGADATEQVLTESNGGQPEANVTPSLSTQEPEPKG